RSSGRTNCTGFVSTELRQQFEIHGNADIYCSRAIGNFRAMKHHYRAIASRDLPKTNMGIKRRHSAA
ncbi:MAG: hypothetical protein WCG40_05785, partial [Actinomycetes bacterium]